MKALTFEYSIPRYLMTGLLDRRWPAIVKSPLAPVRLRDIPEPELPGDDWVRVRPRVSGLCGSDMGIILCHESLTMQPFASYPFVLGHEVCAEIIETGGNVVGFEDGDRVTIMPLLGCGPRGIDPPCSFCAEGRSQLCENYTIGRLEPGLLIGATAGVGGFISEMAVAHVSQLHKVPDNVSDQCAALSDPLSNGLHMACQNPVKPGETLMVFGGGVMGLATVMALRAMHPESRILVVEPLPFQSRLAVELGADEVVSPPLDKTFYRRIADMTGAKMFTPMLSKPVLIGGVDRVFDTVGNTETMDASFRVLRNAGWYNLLGIGEPKKVDWTPVWLKELTIRGVYGYQDERVDDTVIHDFDLALKLHSEGKLDASKIITHAFKLDDWENALEVALNKGRYEAVKIVFTP